MYSRVNYTIVGIFVVLFGAGMVWFAFWLAKYDLQEEFDTYKLEMHESVSGLSIDSNVKLRGVDIGSVSAIRINPQDIEKVEIFVKIKKGIPIKEDMVAYTAMFGVTGLLSIEIDGGTNAAKTLEPTEDYIPLIKTKPSFLTKLTGDIGGASGRIEALLLQSQKLLSDHNIETLGDILGNIEQMTARGEEVEEKVILSLDEFRVSLANMNRDFKQIQQDFAEIKEVTVPTIDKLMETSKNFNRVTLKVENTINRGDYNLKQIFEPMLIEIRILTNQLTAMSRQLEQNPSELLFKSRKSRKGPGE
ncbi:ABC transporter substrate-binding protein [Sulfurovum sp. TSL6]|uniref:MlaD family protein n=1 Tax=Sulfurovum sp. TSL6 TaxID=2826995 RepID=UPI001CC3B0EC|nr:MlaD family protein [Sulfurovum sp. TSL6]GIT99684.1 ABC transporter substrate-binding protein [Sulfurovum sp. TSL6]